MTGIMADKLTYLTAQVLVYIDVGYCYFWGKVICLVNQSKREKGESKKSILLAYFLLLFVQK